MKNEEVCATEFESSILEILKRFGYTVVFRRNGWVECLVAADGETWQGCGVTDEDSLRDVLHRMLPSRLARSALLAESQETVVETTTLVSPLEDVTNFIVLSKRVDVSLPLENPETLLVQEGLRSQDFEEVAKVAPCPPSNDLLEEPRVDPEPDTLRPELLDVLSRVRDEIADSQLDIALMPASLQRLHITAWILQARAVQEKRPSDDAILRAVGEIASTLTSFCKKFWPGNVRALQLATTPAQALDGIVRGTVAQTWAQAAQRIETAVESESLRGDEFGWHDKIEVPPSDPSLVLEEAISKIESALGPIDLAPDVRHGRVALNTAEESIDEFILAAHLLRWCRTSVVWSLRWGRAMGCLRWIAHQLGRSAHELQPLLDASFVPLVEWAKLLGRDPTANAARQKRLELEASVPTVETKREERRGWFLDAFSLLTNPQIAKLTASAHDVVLDLTPEDFSEADRSVRSRLRKLQSMVRTKTDVASVLLPSEGVDASVDSTASKVASPTERLTVEVRRLVEGKRVLFVTNREDEELRSRIESELACSVSFAVCSGERRTQHVEAAIVAGSFDIVLLATSFLPHQTTDVIGHAAKQAGVRCVRVNKGRMLATVRGLARMLGLDPERT